jgi:glycosyltransferase involved in cell wall biosynthesis
MTSEIPKISVIVPVYNAQEYLSRCLDSIFNQTLKDIEVICIDDFSSDNSANILKQYAENYKNLKVIHLENNHGESVARNTGISLAKGEYLAFVDNDDEIDLNFYEKLYEKAQENDSDIVKGQAIEIGYNGQKQYVKQLQEGGDKLLFLTYWWTAIYKRSLIIENAISFSTNHCLGADLLFLNKAVTAAKDLKLVDGVYYYYYRREDSGDSKFLSEEKIKSALSIFEEITGGLNLNNSSGKDVYNFIFHHFIMSCLYLSLRNEDHKIKQICAQTTIRIFAKCQDKYDLQKTFLKTAAHIFLLLENNDAKGIEEMLIKCKSRMEIIVSGLRYRIKNK